MSSQLPFKFVRFLDTVGDGSGAKSANVDGTTPVVFKLQPGANELYVVHEIIIYYTDTGIFLPEKYGNEPELPNGLLFQLRSTLDDSVLLDLFDEQPVKTNAHWGRFNYTIHSNSFDGGFETFTAQGVLTTVHKSFAVSKHEYLAMVVQDNLTGLSDQTFMAQGLLLKS